MTPEERAIAIAARIADGSAIDWPDATSVPPDSAAPSTLAELKTIAALAALHRAPDGREDDGGSGCRLAMGDVDSRRQDRRRPIWRRLPRLGAATAAPGRAQAAARVSADPAVRHHTPSRKRACSRACGIRTS